VQCQHKYNGGIQDQLIGVPKKRVIGAPRIGLREQAEQQADPERHGRQSKRDDEPPCRKSPFAPHHQSGRQAGRKQKDTRKRQRESDGDRRYADPLTNHGVFPARLMRKA
jgi:hypothetical protein